MASEKMAGDRIQLPKRSYGTRRTTWRLIYPVMSSSHELFIENSSWCYRIPALHWHSYCRLKVQSWSKCCKQASPLKKGMLKLVRITMPFFIRTSIWKLEPTSILCNAAGHAVAEIVKESAIAPSLRKSEWRLNKPRQRICEIVIRHLRSSAQRQLFAFVASRWFQLWRGKTNLKTTFAFVQDGNNWGRSIFKCTPSYYR